MANQTRTHYLMYDIVDEAFRSFVDGNQDILNEMADDSVLRLFDVKDLCSIYILGEPYNIIYIGKTAGVEGPVYSFLNSLFENMYQFYDVK